MRPAASYQREIEDLKKQLRDERDLHSRANSELALERRKIQDMERRFEIADRIFKIRMWEPPEHMGEFAPWRWTSISRTSIGRPIENHLRRICSID